jgi:glycosyltransferase involved in cell wall biosynthesis
MKIAVYSHYYSPEIGAPSARFQDLTREWIRSGDSVQVFTCVPNHPAGVVYPGYRKRFYQREVLDGSEVHRVWTYVTPNKGFVKKTIGHVSFWPSAIAASRRHMRETPDVLIGTSPTFFAAMAADHVARVRKRPFIMEVRDLWPALFVELGVLKNRQMIGMLEKLELSLYRHASRVVTVTESFRQDLLRRGVPERKVKTIPNGADVDFWTDGGEGVALRAKLGIAANELVVLYIGAHGISQGLTSVLRAAARLRERRDVRFVFVGEGAEKEKLLAFAAREQLSNVTFLDPVGKEEVRAWYSLADVCLVPLRDIPLFGTFIPSKMFEILSMQRPVLASLRGEAAAILERSEGAVIVPPEDDTAIAGAIIKLLENGADARAAMGARGRAFVAAHYSRAALAATYRDVMSGAIADYR